MAGDPWILADVLAPGVVGVSTDTMDRDDAGQLLEPLERVENKEDMHSIIWA